jgi:hypothetical protein
MSLLLSAFSKPKKRSLPGMEDIGPEMIAISLCSSATRALTAAKAPDTLFTNTELKWDKFIPLSNNTIGTPKSSN